MMLEILSQLPGQASQRPPLLFVHGAWHGAWCWAEHFLPYFADRGYPAFALSLRGHGNSPGSLRWASLSDYVADVREAVEIIGAQPVLIGHSMGGGVVQKYLETYDAPGAVLLASMPPDGVLNFTLRFLRRHPILFLRANLTMSLKGVVGTPALARQNLFSTTLPTATVDRYVGKLQDASYRAFLDMLGLNLPNPKKVRTTTFVVGAENDAIFPVADVRATALEYEAIARILPDLAHDMMIDTRWRDAADAIADWLDETY